MPIRYSYQDDALLVLNKPFRPRCRFPAGAKTRRIALPAGVRRFADALVVHRLDMSTSGIVLMARGIEAQRSLSRAFELRQTEKRYVAVEGRLEGEGEVSLP